MHKSHLLSFLASIGARPRKSLSQNFLVHPTPIAKMGDLAQIQPGDLVLEIGAGTGAITLELLARGAHVLAVEKDPLLAKHLARMQTEDQRLEIVCLDFLQFPLEVLRKKALQKWKVVSNLPYQITAPIFAILCENAKLFESATLIVQKEVGERIQAEPHTKARGSLTLFLQFYTKLIGSFPIKAEHFYPKPAIESMALRLNFIDETPLIDPHLFFPIVRKAFQQRRKMLTSSLKGELPLGAILAEIGVSKQARPEELTLHEWIALAKAISTEQPLPLLFEREEKGRIHSFKGP